MTTETDAVATLARTWVGRPYRGERPWAIDVVVSGAPEGAVTYHVQLQDGSPPTVIAGAAPGGASATLEQTWSEAVAVAEGAVDPVVAYMRGTTKTKGGTRPLYELFRLLEPR